MKPDWKDVTKEQPTNCDDNKWYLVKNSDGFVAAVNIIGFAFRRNGNRYDGWVTATDNIYCVVNDITQWTEIET